MELYVRVGYFLFDAKSRNSAQLVLNSLKEVSKTCYVRCTCTFGHHGDFVGYRIIFHRDGRGMRIRHVTKKWL